MTTEQKSPIIRTTGSRFAKGFAIVVIVMVVGAAISIAFQDVWYKYPSLKVIQQRAKNTPTTPTTPTIPEGKQITIDIVFKESDDLTKLWFEINGQKNPDIEVNLGDEITVNIKNEGVMPHAFGVVTNPDDTNSVMFNSAIGSASSPLTPGSSGSVKFKATKMGEYYYICLVPGHALQGMKGKFIVKEAATPSTQTGIESRFDIVGENTLTVNLVFKESDDLTKLWFENNGINNPSIKVKKGTTVTINVKNEGVMPHAFGVVTNPADVNSVIFNSAIGSASSPLLSGKDETVTFTADKEGTYYYICLVPGHALQGMKGTFVVE
jgi:nitrite reductase (NO-forming)